VDEAFAAGALFLLEGAFVQPYNRVLLELGAFRAQFAVGAVVGFAVYVYHGFDGFLFAFYAWVLTRHF
jgi:hypothetical protein